MAGKEGAALGRVGRASLSVRNITIQKVKNKEIQKRKYKNTKAGNQINFENWLEKRGLHTGAGGSCKLIGPGQEGWVEQ